MITGDEFVYLDNNATTPLDPAVIEEMLPFLTKCYGNPSSGYTFAGQARKAVDLARERDEQEATLGDLLRLKDSLRELDASQRELLARLGGVDDDAA